MPYANIEDRRRNSRDNYQRNKEKRLAYAKAYRESHKDKIKAYWESPEGQEYHRKKAREHYWRYRDREVERSREYRKSNTDKIKAYREKYKERRKQVNRAWHQKNKSHVRAYNRDYKASHPEMREYLRMKMRRYEAEVDERCIEDPEYYARHRAKARINYAKRRMKAGKGYSPNVTRRLPNSVRKGEFTIRDTSRALSTNEAIEHIGYGIVMSKARLKNLRLRRAN